MFGLLGKMPINNNLNFVQTQAQPQTTNNRDEVHSTQNLESGANIASNSNKMNHQQPVIDLAIAMVSIPTLIIFALMLESNMREDWTDKSATRWTVLGLGVGLLLVSLLICGYVTHRMGVCLWAGPQEDDSYQSNLERLNAEVQQMIDCMPPSYDVVMGYDIPPPPYHCIVNLESKELPPPTTSTSNYI